MKYEIGSYESLTAAVVGAVSAVEGRDPRSLRPISDVLDPDALDRLFDSQPEARAESGVQLTFVYSKCRVTVDTSEYLTVDPIDPRIFNEREPPYRRQ